MYIVIKNVFWLLDNNNNYKIRKLKFEEKNVTIVISSFRRAVNIVINVHYTFILKNYKYEMQNKEARSGNLLYTNANINVVRSKVWRFGIFDRIIITIIN